MTKLEEARIEINEIDKQMSQLFIKRMDAVKKVIEYKLENNLPIFDEKRELEVIELNVSNLNNLQLQDYYKDFVISMMNISKKYQKDIIEN